MSDNKKILLADAELEAVSGGVLSEVTDESGNIIGVYSSVLKKTYYLAEEDGSGEMMIARAVAQSAAGSGTDSDLIQELIDKGVITQ